MIGPIVKNGWRALSSEELAKWGCLLERFVLSLILVCLFQQAILGAELPGKPNLSTLTAQQVLDDAVAAYGGSANLRMLDSAMLDYEGTILNTSMTKEWTYNRHKVVSRDGYLEEFRRGDDLTIIGFDGTNAWYCRNNKCEERSRSKITAQRFEKKYSVVRVLADPRANFKVSLVPGETIGGSLCAGICVHLESDCWLCMWFDSKSHVVVKSYYATGSTALQLNKPFLEREYSDYQSVSGFLIPFRVDEYIKGNHEIIKWNKVKLLEPSTVEIRMPEVLNHMVEAKRAPFVFEQKKILLNCSVNGIKTRFLLDTGLSRSTIGRSFAESSGIEIPRNGESVELKYLFSTESFSKASIKKLEIGESLPLENVPVLVGGTEEPGFAGIIGMDLLRNYSLKLDFQNSMAFLTPAGVVPGSGSNLAMVIKITDCPYLFGSTDGINYGPYLLDTGSPGLLVINANTSNQITKYMSQKARKLYDGSGKAGDSFRKIVPEIEFSDLVLKNVRSELIKPSKNYVGVNGILGSYFLKCFQSVTLDFPNEQIIFELPEAHTLPASIDFSESSGLN